MKRKWLLLLLPSMLILLIFFVLPLLAVLNNSVLDKNGGFTLEYYQILTSDPHFLGILYTTLKISLITTFITLIIGYCIAYYVIRVIRHKSLKRMAYIVIISPLFTSAVVRSFGWMVLLGNNGLINELLLSLKIIDRPLKLLYNETGIIIGLVYILAPFMILSLTSVLQNIDQNLEDASKDLGLNSVKTFFKVTLPLSFPGILSGSVMVFSLAISAYVTPAMLSGGRVQVLAMLIYEQMMKVFNFQFGSALAFFTLMISLVILALNSYLLRSDWAEGEKR